MKPTTDPVTDINGVIDAMQRLLAELPAEDGVARFTWMYLQVTVGVRDASVRQTFRNPEFLTRLDVVFADLFFDAVRADVAGHRPSPAWAPLFAARRGPHIAPLQFALAGMNAHINRDLPVALTRTAAELGVRLRDDSPEHHDFLTVNGLLATAEKAVKAEFLTGSLAVADHLLGQLDDRVAIWDIARARDAAWVQALMLQRIDDVPFLRDRFLDVLGRSVGFAGRGLLQPLAL